MIQSLRAQKPELNIATVTNNPGNILYNPKLEKYLGISGYYKAPNGYTYAVFDSPQKGKEAIIRLMSLPSYSSLSLAQALQRWTGTRNNVHSRIIANCCPELLAMRVSDILKIPEYTAKLQNAIAKGEGYQGQ